MDRLLRSYLFAPGDNERLLGKVFAAGADAVVLDLEDAVAPNRKDAARQLVRRALEERTSTDPPTWIRINDLRSAEWRSDLEVVCCDPLPGLAGLRVPKVESLRDLQRLDEALRPVEKQAGLEPESLRITCTIESAAGLLAARQLAEHPRVSHLAFGEADFVADVGAELDTEATATLFARSSLVVTARAAGIAPPIAPAYPRLDDTEGLRRSTRQARLLGFFGRSCIHPKQLPAVHEEFTPGAEQVAEARRIVEALERAGGAVAVAEDGTFVDAAVARRARAVLELAAEAEA
ncbi:MAG: CoA ester lyase [bacterium]|nr:CoA ester lyase [bacterium]